MPDSAMAQLKEQLKTEYSYLDVLALALAESGIPTFTGDSTRWSRVILELRDNHPTLLQGIWFTERGYSEQLEDFFRVMARAGALSFANPRFERIDMAPETATTIKAGAPAALQDHKAAIQAMAARLAELRHEDTPSG